MAFLFCDSFDHYLAAQVLQKWQTGSVALYPSLHGYGMNGGVTASLSNVRSRRVICGAWFYNNVSFSISSSSGAIAGLNSKDNGQFVYTIVDGSSTSYGSDLDLWRPNTWNFLELDVLLDTATGGNLYVYLNDPGHVAPVIDLTGVYTAGGFVLGLYYWSAIGLSSTSVADDFYCCDGAALDVAGLDSINAPTGPIEIIVIRPNGAGLSTEWTPTPAVANYLNVADITPDGDVTFNSADDGMVGDEDLVEMENISTGDRAIAMHQMISCKKTLGGVGQLTMTQRYSGTTYDLESRLLPLDYMYRMRVAMARMPNNDAITDARVNGIQTGYRRQA